MSRQRDPFQELLERINSTGYADTDINRLRDDLTSLVEQLRDDLLKAVSSHVMNYHANEMHD